MSPQGARGLDLPAYFFTTSCESIIISKSSFKTTALGTVVFACYTVFLQKHPVGLRSLGLGQDVVPAFPSGPGPCAPRVPDTHGDSCLRPGLAPLMATDQPPREPPLPHRRTGRKLVLRATQRGPFSQPRNLCRRTQHQPRVTWGVRGVIRRSLSTRITCGPVRKGAQANSGRPGVPGAMPCPGTRGDSRGFWSRWGDAVRKGPDPTHSGGI